MDERDFFREATLRICGSLSPETFLWETLKYLRMFMPVDSITLHHRGEKEHVYFAVATREGGSIKNISIPKPQKVESFAKDQDWKTLVVEKAGTFPPAKPWIEKGILTKDESILLLRLIVEGEHIGGVNLFSDQTGAFTKEHARLLELLQEPFCIALSNALRYQELLRLKNLLADENRYLHEEIKGQVGHEIIGANFGLKGVMELVRQVAPLSTPVLLLGETGVGKEVIATAIHNSSPRRDGPLVKVNCGAIPENLMDSELFGHEKGAFTGAVTQKRGRFERSHGGTIFLDEIGELSAEAQVRLLRVLQEKEIERVGGSDPIKVDIRVIAATHRNLEAMLAEGRFREDLYFRLRVFPIVIPPLRDRLVDIPALMQHFIRKKAREMGLAHIPTLYPGVIDRLIHYHWPGNVRELQNVVERALILSKGGPLVFEDLQASTRDGSPVRDAIPDDGSLKLDRVVSRHIQRVLEMTDGKVHGDRGVARLLDVNPSTLRKKMRKLGIPFGRKVQKK